MINRINKFMLTPLAIAILAACGGGGGEKQSPGVSPTPSATPAPSAAPSPTPPPEDTFTRVSSNLAVTQFYDDVAFLDRSKYLKIHGNFDVSSFSRDNVLQTQKAYNYDHGRRFWSPLAQSVVKNQLDSDLTYPSTATAVSIGQNNKNNYAKDSEGKNALISNRRVITDHPANVLYKPNSDLVEGARWAADYFEHYYTDENRPVFYEPMNEPFVHDKDFTTAFSMTNAQVRELMTEWFKQIGKAFDENSALSDVNIIGYSAAWPSLERGDFNHWRTYQQPFMDIAGEYMDAYSVHLYDGVNIEGVDTLRSGSNMQAILDLIETYSYVTHGVVKPHAITEYGTIVKRPDGEIEYDAAVNSQTVRSFNHIMLELMRREDRLLTSIPFITDHSVGVWTNPADGNGNPYNPAMWRPNKNNIELVSGKWQFINDEAEDNYLLNDNARFFEFWADVQGRRALIADSDPDLQTAVFVNNDKAFIVLSSLETEEEKEVEFNIAALPGHKINKIELERLYVPVVDSGKGAQITVSDVSLASYIEGQALTLSKITMAPGETVKYTVILDDVVTSSSALRRSTYYSMDYLKSITDSAPISFQVDGVDANSTDASVSTAMLRMSIGRSLTASKKPILMVNGTEVAVPDDWAGYDQQGREDFFGTIDIEVPFGLVKDKNTITVAFADGAQNGGRVASMILEINKPYSGGEDTTSISLSGGGTSIKAGGITPISAKLSPINAKNGNIVWRSSDETIATVNDFGWVTGISAGQVTISATAGSVTAESKPITVEEAQPVASIDIGKDLTIANGEVSQLSVAYLPVDSVNQAVTYESSNLAVVTVDNAGLITSVGLGTAVITATSTNSKTDELTVNVISPPDLFVFDSGFSDKFIPRDDSSTQLNEAVFSRELGIGNPLNSTTEMGGLRVDNSNGNMRFRFKHADIKGITVEGNKTYRIQFDILTENVALDFYTNFSNTWLNTAISKSDAWQTVQSKNLTMSAAPEDYLIFHVDAIGGVGGEFIIDNVTLVEIP